MRSRDLVLVVEVSTPLSAVSNRFGNDGYESEGQIDSSSLTVYEQHGQYFPKKSATSDFNFFKDGKWVYIWCPAS